MTSDDDAPPAPAPEPMARRPWAVAVALVVGLVVLVGAGRVLAEPPTPRPERPEVTVDAAPGTLLSAERVVGAAGTGGGVWRIVYASRSPDGSSVPVSGLVLRPEGDPPPGGFPVVAWAHVTVGAADACAPSATPGAVLLGVPELLAAGAVVVATDYPGLGTPGPHPYLVGASEGAAVLDSVRAARALGDAGAAPDGPVGLAGYSQGGHAVLFARSMADAYAPDLEIAGTVAVAPVTDVGELIGPGASNPELVVFRLLVLRSWAAVYDGLRWADVASPAATAVGEAVDGACTDAIDRAASEGFLDRLWRVSPESSAGWRAALDENEARPRGTRSPLLVVHGGADAVVPIGGTERFAAAACALGEPLTLVTDPEWNHGTVFLETWDEDVRWLAARLAGEPAPEGCG